MSLTEERHAQIIEGIKGTAKFHGAFVYPEECYEFLKLADKKTVDMEPVDGHAYKIYIFTAKNRTADCPVHINIHGGGWVNPHQINDELFSAYLASAIQGVVVDVDYTLSDTAPWPTSFDQCYEVGKFVYAHCKEWDCDTKRISIGGYSAGGSLTAGVALKAAQSQDFPICLQVIGYGPVDQKTDPLDKVGGYNRMMPVERERYFTELYLDGDEVLKTNPYVSPVYASDDMLAKLPRTLICTAGKCNFRFEDESFGYRLVSLGVEVTMRRFLGAGHGFIPHFMEGWKDAADLIIRSIQDASL